VHLLVLKDRIWHDWTLGDHADSVHVRASLLFNAVPMNSGRFKRVELVMQVDYDPVVLANLN
jgi:hypothetical protein